MFHFYCYTGLFLDTTFGAIGLTATMTKNFLESVFPSAHPCKHLLRSIQWLNNSEMAIPYIEVIEDIFCINITE